MIDRKESSVSSSSRLAVATRRRPTPAAAPQTTRTRVRTGRSALEQERFTTPNRSSFGYAAAPEREPSVRALPTRKHASVPNGRLAKSEAKLMTAAIGATALICTVLVIYLFSYARISSLGMREAQARTDLRQARAVNETLLTEYSNLRSPHNIVQAAVAMKMQENAPVTDYIDLNRPAAAAMASAPSSTTINTATDRIASVKVATSGTTGQKSAATGEL